MRMSHLLSVPILLWATVAWAQTTRPAAATPTADDMLKQLLPPPRPKAQPIEPVPDYKPEPKTDWLNPVAAKPLNPPALIREGTYIIDRLGRLTRTTDGQPQFTFEADAAAMKDPPMTILANLKLMVMENAVKQAQHDLRFRITGVVTEYNGKNYILLEKMVNVPDETDITTKKK